MSSAAVLAVLVVLLALSFWRPLRRLRRALGIAHLVATGHAFLVLGYVLGLAVGAERQIPVAHDLGPIIAFVAGWVGFATGMRFELRVLRTVPGRVFGLALVPALAAAVVVGGASAAWLGIDTPEHIAAALVLAAVAASSGPTLAAVMRGRRAGRMPEARKTLRTIELSAGIADIVVVVLAMLAFALFRPVSEPFGPGWLMLLALTGAATLGAATWLFLYGRASDDERMLLGLAMLALVSGFGSWLYLSPAVVAAVAAFVAANLPGERATLLMNAVRRVERPAVVILMTMIGFYVAGPLTWQMVPLVVALTVLRLLAKLLAARNRPGPLPGAPGLATARGWACGLTPQGILGAMVALSFFQVWESELARAVLVAVAAASLVNELIAPMLMTRVLRPISVRARTQGAA